MELGNQLGKGDDGDNDDEDENEDGDDDEDENEDGDDDGGDNSTKNKVLKNTDNNFSENNKIIIATIKIQATLVKCTRLL